MPGVDVKARFDINRCYDMNLELHSKVREWLSGRNSVREYIGHCVRCIAEHTLNYYQRNMLPNNKKCLYLFQEAPVVRASGVFPLSSFWTYSYFQMLEYIASEFYKSIFMVKVFRSRIYRFTSATTYL